MTLPLSALVGLHFKGYLSFTTPVYAFVFIPILELLLPQDRSNAKEDERKVKAQRSLFDWMLYINLPVVFGLLLYAFLEIKSAIPSPLELVGLMSSMGIVLGTNGINVAHELGHRKKKWERSLGKLLLLPALYMHFYIEHNFGHHANAATKEDPATAKYKQTVYSFWLTSVVRQYVNAWRLQLKLLKSSGYRFLSYKNDMFWYVLFQLSYLTIIYFLFAEIGLLFAIVSAAIGFLLLETVNYIEHYGLIRKKLPSGRYERVQEVHSWNSNHVMGRIVLYELTRHSDHHYKSSKKYQLLDCHDTSPQMPFGYPTSMVIALFPPLWFKIMNPIIPQEMKLLQP